VWDVAERAVRAACPRVQTPLYVRAPDGRRGRFPPILSGAAGPGLKTTICRQFAIALRRCRDTPVPVYAFCSLRLSVRTPPFHGGESGSIPLGSANDFNRLARALTSVSSRCPASGAGRAASAAGDPGGSRDGPRQVIVLSRQGSNLSKADTVGKDWEESFSRSTQYFLAGGLPEGETWGELTSD
jgi:hypothetical protein